jgi:hypothetical protein
VSNTDEMALVRRLAIAMERWGNEGGEGIHSDAWDAYAAARIALGCPIVLFPAGYDGDHYHDIEFDAAFQSCPSCEDWKPNEHAADTVAADAAPAAKVSD